MVGAAQVEAREAEIASAAFATPASVGVPGVLNRLVVVPEWPREALTMFTFDAVGIVLADPCAQIGWRNVGYSRSAALVAHKFSAPFEACCEIVFLSERMPITRSMIRGATEWLAQTLGLRTVFARIPALHTATQDIARRLGFKYRQPGRLGNGQPASLWSLDLYEVQGGRFFKQRPVPTAAAVTSLIEGSA